MFWCRQCNEEVGPCQVPNGLMVSWNSVSKGSRRAMFHDESYHFPRKDFFYTVQFSFYTANKNKEYLVKHVLKTLIRLSTFFVRF